MSEQSHSWESHSTSIREDGHEHSTETIILSRTTNDQTEALTVTRDGDEVRVVSVHDGETKDDRIAYSGANAEAWLRERVAEWRADGYQT
jgi:hypothetical protein